VCVPAWSGFIIQLIWLIIVKGHLIQRRKIQELSHHHIEHVCDFMQGLYLGDL
jgi:hypothetical protein